MVEQAVRKIYQEGDINKMEKILGVSDRQNEGYEEGFDFVPDTDILEHQNNEVIKKEQKIEDPLDASENKFQVIQVNRFEPDTECES